MREPSIQFYLRVLEEYREKNLHLPRTAMAKELGIPVGTYRGWYGNNSAKRKPSRKYVRWIKGFLECRELISARRWMQEEGPRLLNMIGFRQGHSVVDFGSGRGDYTLMLAEIVGKAGRVYAVDKDRGVLGELMGRVYCKGLSNIKDTFVPGTKERPPTKIPLRRASVDAVWFADVLHDGYFKEDEQKAELLRNLRAVLKRNGFIAIHPVHMEEKRLKKVVKQTGFVFDGEYRRIVLFHGNEFHKGSVFRFRKTRG
jgi:ubiquinone/menaquinone biosynthesis C-methylase UbiE